MPKFLFEGSLVEFEEGETVLDSLLRAGQDVSSGCKAGVCQACLLRSQSASLAGAQKDLDRATVEAGGFLACQAKASADLEASRFDPSFFPTYAATLESKQMLTNDVCRVSLSVENFGLHPGQFVHLIHESGVKRPYSIASSALNRAQLTDLHIRILPDGQMSRIVIDAQPGDQFTLKGPFGKCVYDPVKSERPLLLIGSGTGLAPLYAVLCDALAQGHQAPIYLFHGSAQPEGLYFRDELNEIASQFKNVRYFPCADERAADNIYPGSPLDHALNTLIDLKEFVVYLCGHPGLVKASQKKCFLAGASLKNIFADRFEASA